MPKFVALLRGINVGTAKRIPMAELGALLMGLANSQVATLLNSGNAVFQASGGISAIKSLVIAPERFAVGGNVAYLFCARGILESKAAVALLAMVGGA